MSWRPTGKRPWQDRNRRGQGSRGNYHNWWEDEPSRKNRSWRSRPRRYSPLRTKIYQSQRDESSDEEVRAEKLKTASLVKSRLNSLTVEDKSESMKQLLVTNAEDVLKETPKDTKDRSYLEKESRRIAHVPKPIKPVPPPPTLPPLLAEQLDIINDVEEPNHTLPQRIDRKLLQDLISMPINDLKKMVDRPSSKDNMLLKDLMKNTRVSLSDAMRKLAEHKLQNFGVENPFTELENLVDPDLAIDVCSKPVETIQALMDIFNLNLDGEYDNTGVINNTTPLYNASKPESFGSESADGLITNESRDAFYQWHSPCSIETNKSFLNSFNPYLGTETTQSNLTFIPEVKIENAANPFSDSPKFFSLANDFTLLPKPVPPPEPLDVVIEKSKRAIDFDRLSDQIQDSINKIQKIATAELNKMSDNASNSPVQRVSELLNNQLLSPHQYVENAPPIAGTSNTHSTDIKTLTSNKIAKPKMTSKEPKPHETVINSLVSSSTQTPQIRLKDSSTQKNTPKLVSRSSQITVTSLSRFTQTLSNVVHTSIQTNDITLKDSEVQTDPHSLANSSTESKSLVDKSSQRSIKVSNRGEQTNHTFITSNKGTQTRLDVHKKNKNDIMSNKEDSKKSYCPKCKTSFEATDTSASSKLPTENNSLLKEFSVLQNDIKALETGSQLRKQLISCLLKVASSTFNNFYNLFNESSEKPKENKITVFTKNEKIRKETHSLLSSRKIERKKIRLEIPKNKSSLIPEQDNIIKKVENPSSLVSKDINKLDSNKNSVKVGLKRQLEEQTVIATKKLKQMKKNVEIRRENLINNTEEAKNENEIEDTKSLPKESKINNLEKNELVVENNIKIKTKIRRNSENCVKSPENNRNNRKSRCNSLTNEDQTAKSTSDNVEAKCFIPPLSSVIERTDNWYTQTYNLQKCSVICSRLPISSLPQLVPNSDVKLDKEAASSSTSNGKSEPSSASLPDPIHLVDQDRSDSNCEESSSLVVDNSIIDPIANPEKNEDLKDNTQNFPADNFTMKLDDDVRNDDSETTSLPLETDAINDSVYKMTPNGESEDVIINSEPEKSITTASELSGQDSEEIKRKLVFTHIEFLGHDKPVTEFKISGNHVLAACGNEVFCFSFKTGKRKRMYSGPTTAVTCLCLLPRKGGEVLYSGSRDQVIRAYSVQNSSLLCSTPELGGVPNFLLSHGKSILNGNLYAFLDNGTLIRLNPKTLKIINKFKIGDVPLLCAVAAEINSKKTLFISTENYELVSKEIDSDGVPLKLDWGLEKRAERLVYHKMSLYCGSQLPEIVVFNFESEEVSKHIITCLEDPVSLCIVEHSLFVGTRFGNFELIDMKSKAKKVEFMKEGIFNHVAVHKKIIVGSTMDGKLIAWPIPSKVRKILQV